MRPRVEDTTRGREFFQGGGPGDGFGLRAKGVDFESQKLPILTKFSNLAKLKALIKVN